MKTNPCISLVIAVVEFAGHHDIDESTTPCKIGA
jgi:hypothetical protein